MFHLPLLNDELCFPPAENAHSSGLLAAGGDLSIHRLVLAYSLGIFPWFDVHDPFLWWSPDPRFVLFTKDFKLSKRQARAIRQAKFYVTANLAFADIIEYCAQIPRQKGNSATNDDEYSEAQEINANDDSNGNCNAGSANDANDLDSANSVDTANNVDDVYNADDLDDAYDLGDAYDVYAENDLDGADSADDVNGTWITPSMIQAYKDLFEEGFAHSVEVWQECAENDIISQICTDSKKEPVFIVRDQKKYQLVGGLYGVRMGHVFCGESMFHLIPEASRAALAFLVDTMKRHNMPLLDSQQKTPHMERMGGQEISRKEYLQILKEGLYIHGAANASPFF